MFARRMAGMRGPKILQGFQRAADKYAHIPILPAFAKSYLLLAAALPLSRQTAVSALHPTLVNPAADAGADVGQLQRFPIRRGASVPSPTN